MDAILSPRRRSLVLGLGALALAGCGRTPTPSKAAGYTRFSGATMGSTYTVRLKAPGHDDAALRDAVQSALDEVDQRMSMYRPDSELSAFNRAAGGTPVRLSEPMYSVLAAADRISRWSNGAFDVTVAPLVERWGFGTRAVREVPAAAVVTAERSRVDWRSLSLDDARLSVTKRQAGVQIDLGGIAKGYGVDRAAMALEARGVTDYMLEVGGEVRTRGVNAAGAAWRIGIEEPDATPQRARWVVPLSGRAMATSGDYRNYFVEGGQRYSHEIDPASGAPIRHSLCSVTVVADDCMQADALATALIVLGAERGRALAEASGIAAQFIERVPGSGFRDSMTSSFAALEAARA
jgi:thiamine biosynthesis lipoprotein